jgi:hypothetical protein
MMKKKILRNLYLIKQCAEQTGFKGTLSLTYGGVTVPEWDEIIESITEYPRYKHNVTVAEGVEVVLLLN